MRGTMNFFCDIYTRNIYIYIYKDNFDRFKIYNTCCNTLFG